MVAKLSHWGLLESKIVGPQGELVLVFTVGVRCRSVGGTLGRKLRWSLALLEGELLLYSDYSCLYLVITVVAERFVLPIQQVIFKHGEVCQFEILFKGNNDDWHYVPSDAYFSRYVNRGCG